MNKSNCDETWQETIRAFFAIKGNVVCDSCIDEIYEKCFIKIKKGRKHIRYDVKKENPGFAVGGTFNKEKRC